MKKQNIFANAFGSKKVGINFILSLSVIAVTTTSCVVHNGHYGIGSPKALTPAKTVSSLNNQKATVTDKTGLDSIDPFKTNQGHFRSSNISQSGKIAFAPTVPDAASPSTGDVAQQGISSAEPIVAITGPTDYSGLVMDGFTSLESFSAHKIDIAEDFDIDILDKGEAGEVYKIKFDLWVEPERQDYWTYIWRWADLVNGFRNYTKDYHAEFRFKIKEPANGDAEVVLVQPVHEGIHSFEMALLQKSSQLAAGGTFQGVAAAIDLAERNREQFVQQLKNPILRGVVDSKSEFHFVVSPRQYVQQRTFRIPFLMSRYSIERGLESGPYAVSAYVLIKEPVAIIEIEVCGNYKKFGNAHRSGESDPIDVERDQSGVHCKTVPLDLQKIAMPNVTTSEKRPNLIFLSWGNRTIDAVKDDSTCGTDEKKAKVKLTNDGQSQGAVLKQGRFNNSKIFWIEPYPDSAAGNKEFVLEFCSNGIVKDSKQKEYFAKKEYQSAFSSGKNLVTGSTSGSEVNISILGVPGEKLKLESIRFGNNTAAEIISRKDYNKGDHIIEFKAIVPDYKIEKVVSVVATIVDDNSLKKPLIPITIEQSFTINEGLNAVAQTNVE